MAGRGTSAGQIQLDALKNGVEEAERLLAQMKDLASQYGVELADLTAPRQQQELLAQAKALEADRQMLERYGVTGESQARKMAPAFNDLLSSALTAGQKLPDTLRPMFDALAKLGLLTDANRAKLLGLAAPVDWQAMQGIAEKYGFTPEQMKGLGGGFWQEKVTAGGKGIWEDYQTLIKGGANADTVTGGMASAILDLVTSAVQNNVAIPDYLKPIIQTLSNWGQLGGIDMASLQFKDLTSETAKQTDALLGAFDTLFEHVDSIAPAIAALVASATGAPSDLTNPGVWNPPDDMGVGRVLAFRKPATVDQILARSASGAELRPIEITVISDIDGQIAARALARYIPGEWSRQGITG